MRVATSHPTSRIITARAEALIRSHARRTTVGRIRVLSCLLAAHHALSHSDIEASLGETGQVNRVTIYRALDWLAEKGLAHKMLGEDRIWRFSAEARTELHNHAHFQCLACGNVTCLDAPLPVELIPLPAGHQPAVIELTVKGTCPACCQGAAS